jgi:hypothetical protein
MLKLFPDATFDLIVSDFFSSISLIPQSLLCQDLDRELASSRAGSSISTSLLVRDLSDMEQKL